MENCSIPVITLHTAVVGSGAAEVLSEKYRYNLSAYSPLRNRRGLFFLVLRTDF